MHDSSKIDSAGDGMTRAGGAFKRLHGYPAADALESCEVFGACGGACLIVKSVFDELGGFDEDFFLSHEDVDLFIKALKHIIYDKQMYEQKYNINDLGDYEHKDFKFSSNDYFSLSGIINSELNL